MAVRAAATSSPMQYDPPSAASTRPPTPQAAALDSHVDAVDTVAPQQRVEMMLTRAERQGRVRSERARAHRAGGGLLRRATSAGHAQLAPMLPERARATHAVLWIDELIVYTCGETPGSE